MSDQKVEFHRLESWSRSFLEHDVVECSFVTRQFGYLQVEIIRHADGLVSCDTAPEEPNKNMLTDEEFERIERIGRIVLRLVHDAPRADTFK